MKIQSHLNNFPENLSSFIDEQEEEFLQHIKEIEKRYQGRWNVNMTDYYWSLKIDSSGIAHKKSVILIAYSFAHHYSSLLPTYL
jgi:hypothetical protein